MDAIIEGAALVRGYRLAGVAGAAIGHGPRPTDPEMDEIAHQLEEAGLVTIGVDADGQRTRTLTPESLQVARQLAMGDEATFNAILDAVEDAGRT